jgi:hypothetical protein
MCSGHIGWRWNLKLGATDQAVLKLRLN